MSDPIARLNAALEGRYRIERELGEGGMATVYLADDLKHERKVAFKVLKPELAAVANFVLLNVARLMTSYVRPQNTSPPAEEQDNGKRQASVRR